MFGQGSRRKNCGNPVIPNKRLDSSQRVQRRGHQPVRPGQQESTPERDIEYRLRHQRHAPHGRVIHPSDENLPGREFQQFAPCAIPIGGDEAFGNERDAPACAQGGSRDRIVVAERSLPGITNGDAIEVCPAQSHRTSPGEVSAVFSKRCHNRSIPCGSKESGKTAAFRGIPAVARRYRHARILQRRDQPLDPVAGKTRVGVAEDEDLGVSGTVFDTMDEVVHLLAAHRCRAGHQHRRVA